MANSATLTWDGLTELRAMLRGLPEAIQQETVPLVLHHARTSEGQLLLRYPSVSGRLRRGVSVRQTTSEHGAAAVLRSAAPHAGLYERGTKMREGRGGNATGKGSRRDGALANRGRMQRTNTFKNVVDPSRERLYHDLVQLLVRRGFLVR
jgi:hypothetical protein